MAYEKQDVEKYLDWRLDDVFKKQLEGYDGRDLVFTKKFLNRIKRFIKLQMWNADFQLKIYRISTGQVLVVFQQKDEIKFELCFMNDKKSGQNGVQWQYGDIPLYSNRRQEGYLSNPLDVQRLLSDFYTAMKV